MLMVPLRYDGRTHGVLKVLSARRAAFDEQDQESLELLGDTVALEIAIQTRTLLKIIGEPK